MCLSKPDTPKPPPPPAPAAPVASPELMREDPTVKKPGGMATGRKKLRIDMASNTGSSDGAGLNIPTA
jgi:hypothetical protein